MTLNPNFKAIGEQFVAAFYQQLDADAKGVVGFYHDAALLTYEGVQISGKAQIMEKLVNVPFKKQHATTKIDCHPTFDGGILVMVLGQVQVEGEARALGFNQTFVLKPENNSFYITNDIFQLSVHNF